MKKKPFTLLELSAAMAVLMIFMLFVMRFFTTSQDVMGRSAGKTDQFERARIVMDLLATDLQNIYYTEGLSENVYFQEDEGSGTARYTKSLSFKLLRPPTSGTVRTDLAFVTYVFDQANYTLKMGVLTDDTSDRDEHLGSDLGVLAEGVTKFRVLPMKANGSDTTAADKIPAFVKIELELMDGEDVEAIRNIKKVEGMAVPATLPDPNKTRFFFREVEIDRGQY